MKHLKPVAAEACLHQSALLWSVFWNLQQQKKKKKKGGRQQTYAFLYSVLSIIFSSEEKGDVLFNQSSKGNGDMLHQCWVLRIG